MTEAPDLTRYAWMSIGVALATIVLKISAWLITDSVGLLSDAMESGVNLTAAVVMFFALRIAARPPDPTHHFGHEKIELFSATLEGVMIIVAAALIVWSAIDRLISPRDLDQAGLGLAVSGLAGGLNLAAATILVRRGRSARSAALVADGRHLLTDVWTTIGVIVAVVLVELTDWRVLDPLVALAVGANIVVTGGRLVWRSAAGLMDPTLPPAESAAVRAVIERYEADGVRFHALRHRVAGRRRFLSVHVLVPNQWTVAQGHELLERFEADLRREVDHLTVLTHLEPLDDPSSYLDEHLDRDDE